MSLLQIDGLTTELDSDSGLIRAVDALSLSIERGQTLALVGESGCGKSMTALSILRLLPQNGRVSDGTVHLQDLDVTALPEARMRDVRGRRISMIFQEPATSLNPVFTVGQQIVEVIERHTATHGAEAQAQALQWLHRVGLPEPEQRLHSYPFQLSGGQKQRVMIAMALAAEPDLVIADEPTTALDVTIQAQILDLLKELQASLKMAILLITHDLAVVSHMAHHVALMYAGQIIETASAKDFFTRPLHPYAAALFAALPDQRQRGRALLSIAGSVPALNQDFAGCRFADRCTQAFTACHAAPPALTEYSAGHAVRCVLYSNVAKDGKDTSPAVVESPASDAEPTQIDHATAQGAASALLLEVRDLRVGFPIRKGLLQRTQGYVQAVDGVSFSLAPARTLALVGESGSGKTTVAKALLQLLRGVARVEGSVELAGQSLNSLQGEALRLARRSAQIVFQDPFASLNPRMRVKDILEEGVASLCPEVDATERDQRVRTLLERVGLRENALGRYPHEFSGGQRQRLAIARALAVQPRLIVADEPTSALDVSVQAQILNLLRELQNDLGLSYLFITHNFNVVEYLADDVAVMQNGKIVEAGPVASLLQSPQHPYTQTLLAAVPRLARTFS
jgi:peptide/nickel transport system ATP-binding protein